MCSAVVLAIPEGRDVMRCRGPDGLGEEIVPEMDYDKGHRNDKNQNPDPVFL